MYSDLVAALMRIDSASAATDAVADQVRLLVDRWLEGAHELPDAEVAFVALHIRNEHAYQTLAINGSATLATSVVTLAHSAALWRLVLERRRPISVDVLTGVAAIADGAAPTIDLGGQQITSLTIDRLASRRTTHLLALPMPLPRDQLAGMLTVEIICDQRIGDVLDWQPIQSTLGRLLETVTPPLYLHTLQPNRDRSADRVRDTFCDPQDLLMRVFARQRETVLLLGETGTGKSRAAALIHDLSACAGGPFVTFSLLGVSEDLQLAQLFGWKRGAFSGAVGSHPGLVQEAQGGTLFIDEVDKLSLAAQAGLLRLLEERRYQRLGDPQARPADDVRFIVATNADLGSLVAAGRFRSDLWYRINVLPLSLPPLRQQAAAIEAFADEMLDELAREGNLDQRPCLSREAIAELERQLWPGNLRQLNNCLKRSYALTLTDPKASGTGIDLIHVQRSLALESPPATDQLQLCGLLEQCAVELLPRLPDAELLAAIKGNPLFGLLWVHAEARYGDDSDRVASLVDKGRSLVSRNYRKELLRERRKLGALFAALGETPPAILGEAD